MIHCILRIKHIMITALFLLEMENFTRDSALTHLRENYTNVNSVVCYQSPTRLKDYYKVLSVKEIRDVLSSFESYSLMKPSHDDKKYNPFTVFHIRDCWQMDLVHIGELAQSNDDIKYLLCVTDCFSKRLWCSPLEHARAEDVKEGLIVIFGTIQAFPKTIVCDRLYHIKIAYNNITFLVEMNLKMQWSESCWLI